MLKNRILLIALCVLLPLCNSFAQQLHLNAQLDSSHIVIGDQLRLRLSVSAPAVRNISIQRTDNWKLHNCEIVSSKTVSSSFKNDQKVYSQEIILTSFDTGVATIEPILVFESDTLPAGFSDPISFHVDSFPQFVDTALCFKDIKLPLDGQDIDIEPAAKEPIRWGRIIAVILLVMTALGAAIYAICKYLVPYIRRRRDEAAKAILKENAGVVAIRDLKELKMKKLWQKGQVKDYYSEISMILRTYMDHQWNINAKEMVTDEIMAAIDDLELSSELNEELHGFLRLSDLVKYAKELPEIEKHEASLKNAYHFVRATDQLEHDRAAANTAAKSKK